MSSATAERPAPLAPLSTRAAAARATSPIAAQNPWETETTIPTRVKTKSGFSKKEPGRSLAYCGKMAREYAKMGIEVVEVKGQVADDVGPDFWEQYK